ncbi:MAG: hypothetical protein ABI585_13685 [Betaproteobacteria bacterium]
MATARELLEQADALMRRNRQQAAHGSREPAHQGPRSVAPSLAVAPAPAATETAPPVAQPRSPALVAAVPDDAGIPVLDDVFASPSVAAADELDVPVLTDAVDEIEVSAPDVDEGEPSDWLATPSEDESVLGPAPPSVAVVPPATLANTFTPHREAPARPVSDMRSMMPPSARAPTPDIEDLPGHADAAPDPDVTVRRPIPTLGAPLPTPERKVPEIEDLTSAALSDLDPDVTWTRPIHAAAVAASIVVARESTPAPSDDEEIPAASHAIAADDRESPSRDDAGTPAAPRTVPSGGEFEALAEEIRMQVLQRIDMFTDTGLRERLGERLKPIVDRASADLVDAINQHVGEILRAYVAEAIEREIDRWRSSR